MLLILHAIQYRELSEKLLGNYLYFFFFSYVMLFLLGYARRIAKPIDVMSGVTLFLTGVLPHFIPHKMR